MADKGKIIDFHGMKCIETNEVIIPFTSISFFQKRYSYVIVRTHNRHSFDIELDDDEVKDERHTP